MRISNVLEIARGYAFLGILCAMFFLFSYIVIYKKLLKGTKKIPLGKAVVWGLFFIYIVIVLGATLGIRSGAMMGNKNLQLFSSYREAWNHASEREWRNLILNIFMFVPMGILLPFMLRLGQKCWFSYLVGFAASWLIELVQLITGRGVFEFDDIFNNTLGCMIGYGIGILFLSLFYYNRKAQNNIKIKNRWVVCFQIPLLLTILVFGSVVIAYQTKELGNLGISYSYRQDMSKVTVTSNLKLSEAGKKAYVYRTCVGTKEAALDVATKVFNGVSAEVDQTKNDSYEDTMVYHSTDDNYCVWVNYAGLTTWYTDVTKSEEGKTGVSFEEIKKQLKKFSIEIPDGATFEENGNGKYTIVANMIKNGDTLLDGVCQCSISSDGTVSGFENDIVSYVPYKEFNIISEKQAYHQILDGRFSAYSLKDISEIKINKLSIQYVMDSKGFYQPVYQFKTQWDGKDTDILIPACVK